MNSGVGAVIVTHESQTCLERCLDALKAQTVGCERVVIVDSGSRDPAYVEAAAATSGAQWISAGNIGYGAANNRGLAVLGKELSFAVILNPDTFLFPTFVEKALELSERQLQTAVFSGVLHGYDLAAQRPTGLLDSTGIFRTWYGRWYDRGQGDPVKIGQLPAAGRVPAVCGALMFCRLEAVEPYWPEVFDPAFFMYKEDIEFCLRLREAGWDLHYSPELEAYHGRGWDRNRRLVPTERRRLAAVNEIKLYRKHPSPYMIWAMLKYLLVRVFDL